MSNENYVNYYVEIMTGTMQDAVLRNISLQANAKVSEDVIKELSKTIEELQNFIDNLKHQSEKNIGDRENELNSNISNLNITIQGHLDRIRNLEKQLSELETMRSEYENVKHQVNHINTYRNELIKEREEHLNTRVDFEKQIKDLNDKIYYLQLTPTKRKKIDESKIKEKQPNILLDNLLEENIKDGGEF